MNGGDTFRLVGVADKHTWTILSDPAQDADRILIVSFTSYTEGIGMDAACVVEAHEYPVLTNRSCLYYEDVREASVTSLRTISKSGKLQMRTPVSQALLQRIRDGAIISDECKEKHKEFLRKQGVISPSL